MDISEMIVYLQNNEFKGFVEPAGAELIKREAREYGCVVQDFGSYFNVVYAARATEKMIGVGVS